MPSNHKPKADVRDVSVIVPTLNAGHYLATCLSVCSGVHEIIVVDGGSRDNTARLAQSLGARVVTGERGRGVQLRKGAALAKGEWLLFLHADTELSSNWREAASDFITNPVNLRRAAAFRFELDDPSAEARRVERLVAWRVSQLGLPYGDQGLLIHRDFYQALGGFRPWPLMEDVDLVRRIGRRRLADLSSVARTSAERWRREGWRCRSLRNMSCLFLYFLGVSPRLIAKLYG